MDAAELLLLPNSIGLVKDYLYTNEMLANRAWTNGMPVTAAGSKFIIKYYYYF